MTSSVLAYLVPRLTSGVEDAATEALAFILNRSAPCRGALDGLLREEGFTVEPIVRVETQVTAPDGSRPDMVGYDQGGAKRLLVESKFWAGLQERQANAYLDQAEAPGVLLFIAPEARVETLWPNIRRQLEEDKDPIRLGDIETVDGARRARIVSPERHRCKRLMLVTWTALLERLLEAAPKGGEVASDIDQLHALARQQDEEAFQPIHAAELGPLVPRRLRGLSRLIDDIVDGHGVAQGWMSIAGLRATAQRNGYGRYFKFVGVPGDSFLCVHYRLWAQSGDTPVWLRISRDVPADVIKLQEKAPGVVQGTRYYNVPVWLKTGVEYEAVLAEAVRQVKEIYDTCIIRANSPGGCQGTPGA